MTRRLIVMMVVNITREDLTVVNQKVEAAVSAFLHSIRRRVVNPPLQSEGIPRICMLKKSDWDRGGVDNDGSIHGEIARIHASRLSTDGTKVEEGGRVSRNGTHSMVAIWLEMAIHDGVFRRSRKNMNANTYI
ncbi:unnamed protein product [Haemonchus placei]|uniref:AKAP7_NLS domain-containing protein n=1 Tax=Haemonchus placei TaxID=6290 RepID=A0A0N4WGC7_HAEPC|nr:unnamed protein product [Haemonchus placei]